MIRSTRLALLVASALIVSACGDDDPVAVDTGGDDAAAGDTSADTPTPDAAEDIAEDTEPDAVEDAPASDAEPDSSTEDTEPDAVEDAEPDAIEDARTDVEPDAPDEDVKLDAEPDSTEPDAAVDVVPDSTPDVEPDVPEEDTGTGSDCVTVPEDTDFGLCELLLGWGYNGSSCVPYSGCSCEPFCHAFFGSPAECDAACAPAPDGCNPDAATADYGPCRLVLGYAFDGVECVLISGCSCEPHCDSIHPTEVECETRCE